MEPYPKLLLSAKDRGEKKAQLRSSENVQSIKSTATDVVSLLHDDESNHGPVMDYLFFLAGAEIPVSTLMYPRQRCALNSEVMSLQLSVRILTVRWWSLWSGTKYLDSIIDNSLTVEANMES